MQRHRWTFRSARLLVLAMGLAVPRMTRAQACCAGSTALAPGRLNLHEQALVGWGFKLTGGVGSFDAQGRWIGTPRGSAEIDLEQDLIATLRMVRHGQLSLLMPLVETYRRVPGLDEVGAGIGDLQLAARWDFTLAGARIFLPGIAVLASLTLPTGVTPEQARQRLTTDATGAGSYQGMAGVSLEQTFGRVVVHLTGSATLRSARTLRGLHTQLGPAWGVFAAAGWMFRAGPVATLTAAFHTELPAMLDGRAVADSGRRGLRFGVSCGVPLEETWRLQGGLFADAPLAVIGKNELASVGLAATVLRTW